MPSPRRPLLLAPAPLLLSLSLLSTAAHARTSTFDDRDALLDYKGAWTSFSPDGTDWQGGTAMRAARRGDELSFAFAGEQVGIFGTGSVDFGVSIDGQVQNTTASTANWTEPTRIFLASGLDRETVHQLVLVTTENGALLLDRVAIAYSSDTELIPTLLAATASGAVSTATLTATSSSVSGFSLRTRSTTSTSTSSSPASTSSTAADSMKSSSHSSAGPGQVAGIVFGSLGAVAIILFLFFLCRRRRRARDDTAFGQQLSAAAYYNSGPSGRSTKRRSSAFLSALNFSRRNTAEFPSTPHGPRHPFAAALPNSYSDSPSPGGGQRPDSPSAGSQMSHTWASRLVRAASWNRKVERIPATREFYNIPDANAVAAVAGPRAPPPRAPLPRRPGEEPPTPRDMEERWRTDGAVLVGGGGGLRSRGPSEEDEKGYGGAQTTVQVYGEAMSDYAASDEVEAASSVRGAGAVGRKASLQRQPIAAHLRRRSLRQEEGPTGRAKTFSVELPQKDLPFPPSAYHPSHGNKPSLASTTFRNPFSSTSSASAPFSQHGSKASHGTSRSFDPLHEEDGRPSSVEYARIAQARPVAFDDDVPLYGPGSGLDAPIVAPVRTGSLRELREQAQVVKPPVALARRPTVTRTESDAGRPFSPPMSRQDTLVEESTVDGYEVTDGLSAADKHRSVAGLIETVESWEETLEADPADATRKGRRSRKDPPPGEEDRSALFSQRERMPRYSASGRDPRVAEHGKKGSISRG
ncbi:hypothetical protein JCM8097_005914 [Rhodosporidiobolus ruineniae]